LIFGANAGLISTFAPADSPEFSTRFQDWRGYRVIGWNASVNIIKSGAVNADGLVGFAPFNQSLLGSATLFAPNTLPSLLELPNVKLLPIVVQNPRSKANFSWFNRRGDINALPFQSLEALQTAEYATGLIAFNAAPTDIVYEVYGKLLVEFKDKNIFNSRGSSTADADYQLIHDPVSPVVKRLNRTII
jgi:hypothetical protein